MIIPDDQLLTFLREGPRTLKAICEHFNIPWQYSKASPGPDGQRYGYTRETQDLRNQLQRLRRDRKIWHDGAGWGLSGEMERKFIVEGPQVFLHDGLRCALGGYMNPCYCSITSARPGLWACSWERVREVQRSETRRFGPYDLWPTSMRTPGREPQSEDYQTAEDWERAQR